MYAFARPVGARAVVDLSPLAVANEGEWAVSTPTMSLLCRAVSSVSLVKESGIVRAIAAAATASKNALVVECIISDS